MAARRKAPTRKPATRKALARPRRKAAPKPKSLRIAGVGNEAVLKATGRAWEEWLKVLDRAGAKAMPHKEIALMLSRKFSVPNWWSQMVSVGYEQARGLRKAHEKGSGFSATASRTVGASLDQLYAAWSDGAQRMRWLPDAPVQVRRSTSGKSMRMTWTAGNSSIVVGFTAKGPGRSAVALEHGKLASAAAVKRQKAYWGDALDRMKAMLEGAT
ncbi:MAG TPA: hypothetical protein VM073_11410 [Usitatibacter sp.]|nr:hypothetical protein [Usitatibacter sp.]